LTKTFSGIETSVANDKPPPVGTPVSSRLSDKLAPTRQHQPTHAPLLSNRGKPFNHSRKSLPFCKSLIRRFDSDPRLQPKVGTTKAV
jgi:hypothetical protein